MPKSKFGSTILLLTSDCGQLSLIKHPRVIPKPIISSSTKMTENGVVNKMIARRR